MYIFGRKEHDVNSPSFAVTPEHRGEVIIG